MVLCIVAAAFLALWLEPVINGTRVFVQRRFSFWYAYLKWPSDIERIPHKWQETRPAIPDHSSASRTGSHFTIPMVSFCIVVA
jgi:hypothetical protein